MPAKKKVEAIEGVGKAAHGSADGEVTDHAARGVERGAAALHHLDDEP
jgi:hypothetical protein